MKNIILIFIAVYTLLGMGLAWGEQQENQTITVYYYTIHSNTGWGTATLTLSPSNYIQNAPVSDESLLLVDLDVKNALSSAGYSDWAVYKDSNNNPLWATSTKGFTNAYNNNATLRQSINSNHWGSILSNGAVPNSTAQSVMQRAVATP